MSELLISREGSVSVATINRPSVFNALNLSVLSQLKDFCQTVALDRTLSALIITGSGEKSFAAGADITELAHLTAAQAEQHSLYGQQVFDELSKLPIPVIAAVNGVALGGGLELALACDFIYASENAQLGLVETSLGLIPGFGGSARLARRVGLAYAAEMIFTAKKIDAQTALRVALVNQVFPAGEALNGALSTAAMIAERGPFAVSAAKRLMYESQDLDENEAHKREREFFAKAFSHVNHQEGISAFLSKQKPKFSSR